MTTSDLPATNMVDAAFASVLGQADTGPKRGVWADASASLGGAADDDGAYALGQVSGQLQARRGGWTGCVSGDARMARDPSTHVTASAGIPWLMNTIVLGVTVDRDVEVPLSSRPEYARAPLDRATFQAGFSMLDFGMRDPNTGDEARFEIMPVSIAVTASAQTVNADERQRVEQEVALDMFRIVATNKEQGTSGTLDVAKMGITGLSDESLDLLRMDVLGFEYKTPRYQIVASGGVLVDDAEPMSEPKNTHARPGGMVYEPPTPMTGGYDVRFAHSWKRAWLETRLARTAFVAADNTVALEDRASSGVSMMVGKYRGNLTAFTARTRAFVGDGAAAVTGGGRLAVSQQLDRHIVATVDAELARSFYGVADGGAPEVETSARVLAHLDWHVGRLPTN